MSELRKSGTVAALTWAGALTDPRDAAFPEALRNRRFRTIENAASEEVSAGWVTPLDPTGDSFDLEDLDAGAGTWLRVRVDTKKLPKAIVAQHLAAAAKSRGRALSARERREIRDGLAESLLPRVIPATSNIDALLFHDRRRLLLFAGGKSARDTFGKLFFESFGVPLVPLDPLALALAVAVGADADAVAKLEPTRWPRAKGVA